MSGGKLIRFMVMLPDGSITISELTLTVTEMQTLVGGDFEMLPSPDWAKVTVFANTEGKRKGLLPNWTATKFIRSKLRNDEFLVGTVVLTGLPDASGELTSLPDETIKRIKTWATE